MSTLVVYPDTSSWWTTIDGRVMRWWVDETLATISSTTWNTVEKTWTTWYVALLQASSTNNQFAYLARWFFTFDTSPLTSAASISDATLSLYWEAKLIQLWTDDIHICQSTQENANDLVNWDYLQVWSTSFWSVAWWDFSIVWYNDITLNASWKSNISKTWISKFAARWGWDIWWSFWWVWDSTKTSWFSIYLADQTGTTNDPKLTITYELTSNIKSFDWLANSSLKSVIWLEKASVKKINWLA